MAMACLVDLAPCFPRRILSISSCTNSPACVLGDLPSRLSCMAFRMVCFLGMERSLHDLHGSILSGTTPGSDNTCTRPTPEQDNGCSGCRHGLGLVQQWRT